ncbi:MAG: bifunctional phosphoribosylaminoimidazolecarboxamide formyltransferase/IMP cyclohydrolase, partial [Fimbriimonadaceae bacterium]|nr:bifunctional phosphoribosylaminoimidazolecarboxamide formyltransferase/IMP cyclohydrolase [Fimbriimonadaceae bacterium]
MKQALLSVTDKTGLVDFARRLASSGWRLISTGGTARTLRDAGLPVTEVQEVTGFPEMLDGRVKTLHPKIHGGLLGLPDRADHASQMAEAGIEPIQLLVVNLYAFEQTLLSGASEAEVIEAIDIGGPGMIRAAAKNMGHVAVVVDPADYPRIAEEAESADGVSAETRRALAAKAFRHTALYDSMISRWLTGDQPAESATFGFRLREEMRYGENPHQKASLYVDPLTPGGIVRAELLNGKPLSYNNVLDADAAWELACDLPLGSVAIIKHGNPCGAAARSHPAESCVLARGADPISAFGGVLACHAVVDAESARAMTAPNTFLEIVIAPDFTPEALEILKGRKGWGANLRILRAEVSPRTSFPTLRSVRGGVLVQSSDEDPGLEWKVVSQRSPSEAEMAQLRFAWSIVPHVKSNAIIVCGDDRLLGVGAGQMNRVQSVRLALEQAGELAAGSVLASDAFFPFPDSIETAH